MSLERPDSITTSAVAAREEIGRAVAEKIRQMEDARYMRRFAQSVLPRIDRFLESPEEKRLRRLRTGTVTALIGLAIGIPALSVVLNTHDNDVTLFLTFGAVAGSIAFATGLGLLFNGLLFSRPRKGMEDRSSEAAMQDVLDIGYSPQTLRAAPASRSPTTSNLAQPVGSVTEDTTIQLKSNR